MNNCLTRLMAKLLYDSGLRMMECVRLRVKMLILPGVRWRWGLSNKEGKERLETEF